MSRCRLQILGGIAQKPYGKVDRWGEGRYSWYQPPPSPQYPKADEDDEVKEITPPAEFQEQGPPTDAEEEEIDSNPPLTEDKQSPITLEEATPNTLNKATPIVSDEAAPINLEEGEPTTNAMDDLPQLKFLFPSVVRLLYFTSLFLFLFFVLGCNGLFG